MKGIIINNLQASGLLDSAAQRKKFGNAILSLNTNEDVLIKDCVLGQNGYNYIEIGLNSVPKNVTIDNCDFTGELSNNAILVFATQDNTVVNIKNCKFNKLSNMLRLSNRLASSNVVVNIENCSVEQWEDSDNYAGAIILEDYTSTSLDEALAVKRFGSDKLTINITNLQYKGKKVNPVNIKDIVSTGNKNTQVIYMSIDKASYTCPTYNVDLYPVINIK